MKKLPSELHEKFWSILDAQKVRAANLTYFQAERKLKKIFRAEPKNAGLVIVTNDVAARSSGQIKNEVLKDD